MPKRKLPSEIIQLFAVVSGGLKGYWSDEISIDKMIVEANYCPKCKSSLEYKAFSNMTEYRAFGICNKCLFAKEFWLEGSAFANYKKQICKVVAKTSAARR
jgi:benzoyl-CoA reductase/2-hydroxyglutaryl-CoA dehydratase subunit BcrC/BadD/HgdB